MSTKAVIVALLLAVVMGIAAIFLLRAPSGPSSRTIAVGDRLLALTPGEIEKIVIAVPGEPRQFVERSPGAKSILGADADWQLRIDPAKPGDPVLAPWPIEPTKLQALLRILTEVRAVALPAGDAQLGQPTQIELQLSGGRIVKLSLAGRTLAGTGLVEIVLPPPAAPTPIRAVVSDQLHDVFTRPGPRAWRQEFPAAGIAPDASRIRITGSKATLALAKQSGQWFLREPVAAPADPNAVQQLLARVQRIAVADFLDSGAASQTTGLDKPVAAIVIEADRRTVEPGASEPKTSTDTLTLSVGNAADASMSKLFAGVNRDRVVLLDARTAQDVSTDPATFVWPYPLRETPSDIGAISISLTNPLPTSTGAKTIKRSGTKWSQVMLNGTGNKTEVPLSESEQRDAEALLACLVGTEKAASAGSTPQKKSDSGAPRPAIALEKPTDYRIFGAIEVSSLTGTPIATLELGAAGKDQVIIESGPVYRVYSSGQLPTLLRAAWDSDTPPAAPVAAPPKP